MWTDDGFVWVNLLFTPKYEESEERQDLIDLFWQQNDKMINRLANWDNLGNNYLDNR